MEQQVSPLFQLPLADLSGVAGQGTQMLKPVAKEPQKYVEQDGKHKGVAGVARDILGTLGDFLLTKLGVGPMYAPAQKQRKLAIAQQGFQEDPMGAIERVSSIDSAFGSKLREQHIDNQALEINRQRLDEDRDARIALAKQAADQKIRNVGASMLGSMATWDEPKRKQYYPQMRGQVIDAAKRQGLDLSAELPGEYDGVMLDAWIDQSVPVGTQRSQRLIEQGAVVRKEQGEERIGIAKEGVEIRGKQADKKRRVGSYVNNDGFNVIQYDDGSEQISSKRVQPKVKGKAPVVGQTATIKLPDGTVKRIKIKGK